MALAVAPGVEGAGDGLPCLIGGADALAGPEGAKQQNREVLIVGVRADDLQTSMAASGVPISAKDSGLLDAYIVRTVAAQSGPRLGVSPIAGVRGFERGEVSTCAWVPPSAWPQGLSQAGCAAVRCH